MTLWPDDLNGFTLQEIRGWQVENREWSKDLRRRFNLLVNNRLANSISQAEYLAGRTLATQDMNECQRRAAKLNAALARFS